MASGSIKGITIELNGDTTGLDKALKSISSESASLSKDLKTVNQLLKLDPGNAELLAQKQQILAQSISKTAEKLEILRGAQEEVKAQFERGEISREQYIAFQNELVRTEQRMNSLTDEQDKLQNGFDDSADSAEDTTGAVKDLGKEEDKTSKETSNLGENLKKGLVAGAKAAAAAVAAATAAVTAAVGGIVNATAKTAEYGDNIDKMSQKLGMSAEAYQEWGFIMEHNGGNIDSMTSSMKKLADAVVDQSDTSVAAFEKLGISMEDAASMSQEDLFSATITALQGMEDGTERTALATDLLGKSAMELGPLLNQSAEDTEEMRKQAHELGGVMSDESVKAAAQFQDSMTNMQTALLGAGRGITAQFMPALSDMMDGIAAVVSGDSGGIKMLEEGLRGFTEHIAELIPEITTMAESILPVIITAITDNLPMLLNTAADILDMLAQGLLDALPVIVSSAGEIILKLASSLIKLLPQILKVGLQIIKELALGIAKALPKLIPTIVDVVLEIVDVLIDNLDMLIDAAIEIIMALAQGIIDALPRLIQKAPVIIQKLVDALVRNAPKLLSAAFDLIVMLGKGIVQNLPQLLKSGAQIVGSLASGILNALGKVGSAAAQIVTRIWSGLKDLPRKALQWGRDMLQGFVDGIKSRISAITDSVKGVANKIKNFLHFSRPDEGPLREYQEWMPDMMQGLALGIRQNMKYVKSAVSELASAMVPGIDLAPTLAQYNSGNLKLPTTENTYSGGASTNGNTGNVFNITFNVSQMSSDYDARRAAVVMAQEIDRLTQDNSSLRGAWSI